MGKAWNATDGLMAIRKSDIFDKIKVEFFQAAPVSVHLFGISTWTLDTDTACCVKQILTAVACKSA